MIQRSIAVGIAFASIVGGSLATYGFTASHRDDTPPKKKRIPTFAKDIAPIVYDKCVTCHRPGEAGQFSLVSYQDVKKKAQLVAQITSQKLMPPWKPGACDYAFKDDRSLSKDQIDEISAWVAAGMPKGSNSDMPPMPKFSSSWKLGEPDMILEMPKAYHVPADGNDIYRNFVIPVHIPDDVYIRAVDFEPSCRAVVHHCLFYFDTTGLARQADGVDGQPGYDGSVGAVLGPKSRGDEADSFGSSVKGLKAGNLGGWAVGAQPEQLPEGLAYTLPKGADVILATHFHLDGKPEVEKSKIGLYFAKKPPTKEFASLLLPPIFGFFSNLDIPAGQKDYTLIDSFTLPVAVKAFSVSAHAHYLGKDFQLTATLPDGAVKNLFTIPKWDFNWQGGYRYQDYVSLPAGTKLTSTMHYDNSSDNVNNPSNPPKHVKWGEQSTDEMGSLILSVVPEKDGDMESLKKAYMTHLINTITAHDGWKKIQEMQKKKQGQ